MGNGQLKRRKTGTHLSADTSRVQCSLVKPTKFVQIPDKLFRTAAPNLFLLEYLEAEKKLAYLIVRIL